MAVLGNKDFVPGRDTVKALEHMSTTRMMPARPRAVLHARTVCLLSMLVVTACDAAGDRSARGVSADTVILQPVRTIGLEEGDPDYLFGKVTSVAVDVKGRIYVGDRSGATVRVFDEQGRFLEQLARQGGGPGELSGWPSYMTFGPGGRLYIRDGVGVTVLGNRAGGTLPDSVVAVWRGPALGDLGSSDRDRVLPDGRYYKEGFLAMPGTPVRFFYAGFEDGVANGDTVEVPAYPALASTRPALFRLGAGPDRLMLEGLNKVPFAAAPIWHISSSGTLLSSDGVSSTLIETDARGDTLRTLRLPTATARRIPSREKADSLRALDKRIEQIPGPLSQVDGLGEGVEARRLPEVLPTAIGLVVRDDGSIWLERWPPEGRGGFRYYDVFDNQGRLLRSVVLAAPVVRDPPPCFGEHMVVGVIRDPDTGVERVVAFDVRRTGPGS